MGGTLSSHYFKYQFEHTIQIEVHLNCTLKKQITEHAQYRKAELVS